MAERGNRRAERANEYLSTAGRERIRRLREHTQQISEYLRARQARQERISRESSAKIEERSA